MTAFDWLRSPYVIAAGALAAAGAAYIALRPSAPTVSEEAPSSASYGQMGGVFLGAPGGVPSSATASGGGGFGELAASMSRTREMEIDFDRARLASGERVALASLQTERFVTQVGANVAIAKQITDFGAKQMGSDGFGGTYAKLSFDPAGGVTFGAVRTGGASSAGTVAALIGSEGRSVSPPASPTSSQSPQAQANPGRTISGFDYWDPQQ